MMEHTPSSLLKNGAKALLFPALLLTACNKYEESPTKEVILSSDKEINLPVPEKNRNKTVSKKCIYLTIDDAPLNGSVYIDSIVQAEKVKTSLFMVGKPIKESGRFKQYYTLFQNNPYLEIYNHSYSHANNRYADFYKTPESVLEDFEQNQTEYKLSHKIARLPGRNLWQLGERKKNTCQTGATSAELLSENGYQVFGWDVEWKYNAKDYSPIQSIDELISEIENIQHNSKSFTSNHIVLLAHIQMFNKQNEDNDLGRLINELKEREYSFEYLSFYPGE